jgi:DNA topoisomerase-1
MAKKSGTTSAETVGVVKAKATKAPKTAAAGKPASADKPVRAKAAARRGGGGKHLVIVESPAKAKTINKYLGDDFVVRASMGHVRDLPSKGMCVDIEGGFIPKYEVLESRGKVISELRKLAKDADDIYLATDLDREGEAIAWHLKEALAIPDDRVKRVIFNAITKTEIQKAFQTPRLLDMDRVNAQQARRILDRLVGYEVSPVLWRKVAKGLSAGRVQSVAVRLVVEREAEIEKFVPDEYWKIGAVFTASEKELGRLMGAWGEVIGRSGDAAATKAEKDKWLAANGCFNAELTEWAGKKFEPADAAATRAVAEALGVVVEKVDVGNEPEAKGPAQKPTTMVVRLGKMPPFVVRSIERKRQTSRPGAPFITSTLQQAASSRLSFGAQKTMRTAQGLYEGGYITYMRTDSTNLSGDAISMARGFIGKQFGDRYLPEKPNFFASSNKGAQEAHEAIRPTDATMTPELAREKLSSDDARLYDLIWRRFVACQMTAAEFDQTAINIVVSTPKGEATFRATGRKLVFDGFMRVTGVTSDDQLLPELGEGQPVFPIEVSPSQHFTQPPPRFTEASLVKELEKLGIGRPSTYASIIQTIQDRQYVVQLERRFHATLLGRVVTEKLIQAFPEIMDVQFTAGMERKLDEVEENHADWIGLLRDFYGPFHEGVASALGRLEHAGGAASPYKCPKCGKEMLYRISSNGFFLACNDRECGTTQPVDLTGKPTLREVTEHKCPNCGRELIKRKGRFGEFLGCAGYSQKGEDGKPLCTTIINLDKDGKPQPPKPAPIKTDILCEKCKSPMLLRDSKRGPFLGCSSFPKCRATKMMGKLEGDALKAVEALLPELAARVEKSKTEGKRIVEALTGISTPAKEDELHGQATDIDCEECGKPMTLRKGKRGFFLGCSGYPKCKTTAEVPARLVEELGINGAKKQADGPPAPVDEQEEIE